MTLTPMQRLMAEVKAKREAAAKALESPKPAPSPDPAPEPEPEPAPVPVPTPAVVRNPFESLTGPLSEPTPTANATANGGAQDVQESAIAAGSLEALAAADTDSMMLEPVHKRQNSLIVQAILDDKTRMLQSESEVRDLCDEIDGLIEGQRSIQGPNLIYLRTYVERLMITLKKVPEYESVLIAKDIRNIMSFIRSTREAALELREVKTEKKAIREVKANAKIRAGTAIPKIEASTMSNIFDSILGKGPGKS